MATEPTDRTEIKTEEFHPAARSAYRWLKGFMANNPEDYMKTKEALANAGLSGNRQAEICMGTIERLAKGQPVSDRYLLGLCWTILYLHNHEAIETVAEKRLDKAYPHEEGEL